MAKQQRTKKHRKASLRELDDDALRALGKRLDETRKGAEQQFAKRDPVEWAEARGPKLRQLIADAYSGARQRVAGHNSPGPAGQFSLEPKNAKEAVQEIHRQYPGLTWSDVCTKVGCYTGLGKEMKAILKNVGINKAHYKSNQMVCKFTRELKWPDPRRKTK